MSQRTEILQRLWSVVDGATAANCFLRRVTDLPPGQLPAVLIIPGNTPVRALAGGVLEHSMEVAIVTLTQGAAAMADAEVIAEAVTNALRQHYQLDGLATDMMLTGVTEEKEQTDQVRCALAVNIAIRFETALWAF